jgi:hypothetical protein
VVGEELDLPLGLLALRDVAHRDHASLAAPVRDRPRHDLDGDPRAVLADGDRLDGGVDSLARSGAQGLERVLVHEGL